MRPWWPGRLARLLRRRHRRLCRHRASLRRRCAGRSEDGHALRCHVFENIFTFPGLQRFDTALRSSCSMAGAAPGERIAQADHEMAGAAHIAGNEDRLPGLAEKGESSSAPGPKARVAPLRWTQSCFFSPLKTWVSNLAMLWQTS